MDLHKKNCGNCLLGRKISINQDILCIINGAVSVNYVCNKHRFTPYSKSNTTLSYKCSDCCHFISLNKDENGESIGYCHMFTVRHYNGSLRKVCSKFSKNSSSPINIKSVVYP